MLPILLILDYLKREHLAKMNQIKAFERAQKKFESFQSVLCDFYVNLNLQRKGKPF